MNGTSTIPLPRVETASPTGELGGFICTAIIEGTSQTQNNGTGPGNSNPEVFFGGADRNAFRRDVLIVPVMLIWLYSYYVG